MRFGLLTPAAACVALLLSSSISVNAENWPRFRGADGAGISHETGFPTSWTAEDYAWVIDLPGQGHSSPVVWEENLYLCVGLEEGTVRRLVCLNSATGEERWRRDLTLNTVSLHLKNSFASGSPVTDGQHVVAAFGDESQLIVACWDKDGKELWKQNLGEFISQHGPSCTPVIHGRYVIVPKEMMGPSAVFAFDVETGTPLWKTEREFRRTSYATPIVRTRKDGIEEVICVSGMMGITGLELSTGKMLWKSPEFPMRTVGSPVLADDLVLCSCGSGGSGKLVQAVPLDQTGNIEPKYTMSQKIPYVPTPIYKDGFLYMLMDGGIMSCVKADTGEQIWIERVNGKFSGSPVWVEGRLYAIDESGIVVVLAAGPEFQELGRVELGDVSHSTPAVANGRMYLKTLSKLYCLPAK